MESSIQIKRNWTRTATIEFSEVGPGYLVAYVASSDYEGKGEYFASRSYDVLMAAVDLALACGEGQYVDESRIGRGRSVEAACEAFKVIENTAVCNVCGTSDNIADMYFRNDGEYACQECRGL